MYSFTIRYDNHINILLIMIAYNDSTILFRYILLTLLYSIECGEGNCINSQCFSGLQDSSVDQLVRERPGCLLRSDDPDAELRYLVEVRWNLGWKGRDTQDFAG